MKQDGAPSPASLEKVPQQHSLPSTEHSVEEFGGKLAKNDLSATPTRRQISPRLEAWNFSHCWQLYRFFW
jgi:hypothetical protein